MTYLKKALHYELYLKPKLKPAGNANAHLYGVGAAAHY